MPEHWTDGKTEGPFSTPEAKVLVAKYDTENAAIEGGLEAQQKFGKQFVLPESMDKLADDKMRNEFRGSALKVLGMEPAANVEALADLNMKDGQAEGAAFDENLATSFKQFVVEGKINKADAQKMVGFYNKVMTTATAAAAEKATSDAETAAKECDAKLTAHYGSEDALLEKTELFKRAMENNVGLSAEEVAELGDALALSTITTSPVLQRVLLDHIGILAKEGTTEGGGGGGGGGGGETEQTPYQWKQQRWPKSKEMWGKEDDKWENESPDNRKRAGRKE